MKKYNILIPIAGAGSRFPREKYIMPKPLIRIDNKTIVEWTMDCIDYSDANLIFIIRKEHIDEFGIDSYLKKQFGNDTILVVADKLTDGAVCSCLLAEEYINNDLPLFIHCSDIFFEKKLNPSDIDSNYDGCILTFKSNSPNYSYSEIDENGIVKRTKEKSVISNLASVGVYHFKTGKLFVDYSKKMIEKNIRTNNEFYICPLYNLLIEDGLKIYTKEVEKMHVFGTPDEYHFFVENSLRTWPDKKTKVALCSDHSGFDLKEECKSILEEMGIEYVDYGIYSNKDCDYFEYVKMASNAILNKTCNFGFGFCRSGQGVNICANKIHGIRAALVLDDYFAKYAIRHNCCNFFSISSKYVDANKLKEIIIAWKENTFDGGRHQTRIQKLEEKI